MVSNQCISTVIWDQVVLLRPTPGPGVTNRPEPESCFTWSRMKSNQLAAHWLYIIMNDTDPCEDTDDGSEISIIINDD